MRRAKARATRARVLLPLQALYSVATLASSCGMGHRRMQRLLRSLDVELLRMGKYAFVPLTELEAKAPALWESIRAVQTLLTSLTDR